MTVPPSVLVVDDDDDLRSTVAEALELEGYGVAAAANGRQALDALLGGLRPDVILLDMMMPEMDGLAFRAEQRQHPEVASIPIVIFTAYGVERDTAEQLDAQAVLRKPLRLSDMTSTIAQVIAANQVATRDLDAVVT
jgi:two-component system response regulator MprA